MLQKQPPIQLDIKNKGNNYQEKLDTTKIISEIC